MHARDFVSQGLPVMTEEYKSNMVDSDQAEAFVDDFYVDFDEFEEHLQIRLMEEEDVAFYDMYRSDSEGSDSNSTGSSGRQTDDESDPGQGTPRQKPPRPRKSSSNSDIVSAIPEGHQDKPAGHQNGEECSRQELQQEETTGR